MAGHYTFRGSWGAQVPVRELVRPPRRGRKVVLLGDTCNSRAILRALALPPAPSPTAPWLPDSAPASLQRTCDQEEAGKRRTWRQGFAAGASSWGAALRRS